jgi:hypothetical protein
MGWKAKLMRLFGQATENGPPPINEAERWREQRERERIARRLSYLSDGLAVEQGQSRQRDEADQS